MSTTGFPKFNGTAVRAKAAFDTTRRGAPPIPPSGRRGGDAGRHGAPTAPPARRRGGPLRKGAPRSILRRVHASILDCTVRISTSIPVDN
jgi:hypothetical protein